MAAQQKSIVYLKNQFTSGQKARISVFDRAFLFGDSIFEVMVTRNQTLFDFEGHYARLMNSSKLSGIKVPLSKTKIRAILKRGIQKLKSRQEVRIRLMVTRGLNQGQTIGTLTAKPYLVIFFSEFKKVSAPRKLWISSIKRNPIEALNPVIKSGNYLNNILAIQEAQKKGFDDAVFENMKGQICEATTSNIFVVKKGKIYTPPLSVGILPGRTRVMIKKLCGKLDIPFLEKIFTRTFLLQADEVFISNTPQGIMLVKQVNHKKWTRVPLATRLRELLEKQY